MARVVTSDYHTQIALLVAWFVHCCIVVSSTCIAILILQGPRCSQSLRKIIVAPVSNLSANPDYTHCEETTCTSAELSCLPFKPSNKYTLGGELLELTILIVSDLIHLEILLCWCGIAYTSYYPK